MNRRIKIEESGNIVNVDTGIILHCHKDRTHICNTKCEAVETHIVSPHKSTCYCNGIPLGDIKI